ncbi:importin karyopherin beta 4, putative [Theileria equi strain WA]|uniref:Importin karyopherin beta 4, putative n=1 Tax=Theileria equi strain WA TaxID=1537102 RepID=L0AZ74_THEEQ|nr:importin karyopherin beta 4, putative [Theileria equi strain WA]AFZ80316.1 importin karyopherin beta 4, putative [Theileria equi strain WA]|eukprot:XP_004829982.1 importin karyopherin beta 4, putative [Theileria equi strain WA]
MTQHITSEAFVSLLEALSSTDNQRRTDADAQITALKQHDINTLVKLTLSIALSQAADDIRLQSVILIRLVLDLSKSGDTPRNTWNRITPDVKNLIKTSLLKSLETEVQDSIRRNVCDTIADLCISCLDDNEWPELSRCTLQLIQNDNVLYKKSGLKLLGECFGFFAEDFSRHVDSLAQLIKASLMNPNASVRTEAICAVSLAIEVDVINLSSRLGDAVPLILEGIKQLLISTEPSARDEAERSLAGVVMIVDNNAKVLKQNLSLFFTRMADIALGEGQFAHVDHELRCLALESLITLPERKPKMALTIPNFGIRMVSCLMSCMLDIQDDSYAEWLETGEEDDDIQRLYDAGEEGLDRLGKAFENIDNCPFMDWVLSTASQYIQQPLWQHKFVGIMAISQTIEYLMDEEVEERMPSIINIMLEKLKDSDFRIRFAACQTIGQLALDHQPYVQLNFCEQVIPSLIATFDDSSPRVQSHALSAFVNFAEEVQKEDLLPFADIIVEKLLSKINLHTKRAVREQAVTSIAVIAGVLEENFIKYYSTVVPLMKEIISKCLSTEERTCRGKAIECISIIGLSIGADVFRNDGIECMNALIQIMEQPSDSDDPVKEYIDEALSRLCTALGTNFCAFLPKVVPILLKELDRHVKSFGSDDDMTLALGSEGAAGLRTSLVEELERTLNLIGNIVEEMKEKYDEYIVPTATAIFPTLSLVLTGDLKQRALHAIAQLIEAKRSAIEKGDGNKKLLFDIVLNTVNTVISDLEKSRAPNSEYDVPADILSVSAHGLHKCIDSAGPGIFDQNILSIVSTKLLQIIEQSSKLKAIYKKCRQEKDLDQDELLALDDDEDAEQSFRSSLLDIFGSIMKHHPDEFLAACQPLCLKFILLNLGKTCPDDISIALYLCDDMIEHLKGRILPFWDQFLPHIFKHVESRDANVRQSACYGVSLLARIPEFSSLANESAQKIVRAIKLPFASSSREQQTATDNAVAALGDLIRYHGASLSNGSSYLNVWLSSLPLKRDEVEGKRVHKDLMELVLASNPTILGPDNVNLSQLVKIFISIYETDFSTEELNMQIISVIRQLGDDFIQKLAPSLSRKLQKQLRIIAKTMANK